MNCEKLDQCIFVGAALVAARLPFNSGYATSASHGASRSLSKIIWRTRTRTTAIEYIQHAASRISIAHSIDGAILKLLAVIVAP